VQAHSVEDLESASRPSAQFLCQVKEEVWDFHRRYILAMSRGEVRHDIHTKAYERVKKVWELRGIWHSRSGILPGPTWIHELPREDRLREEMGDDYLHLDTDGEFVYDVPGRPTQATGAIPRVNPAGGLGGLLKAPAAGGGRGPSGFAQLAFAGPSGGFRFGKPSDPKPHSAVPGRDLQSAVQLHMRVSRG
jgi:hypothetical protein